MKNSFISKKPMLIVIMLILTSGLFKPVALPDQFCKMISMLSYIYLFGLYILSPAKNKRLMKYVKYIIWALFLSVFSAFFFHDQSPLLTLRIERIWFGICFCFFLYKYKCSTDDIYKGLMVFGLIWMVLYFMSVFAFPTTLFHSPYEESEELTQRGWYRIYITGAAVNPFLFYWNLQKYIVQKNRKYLFYAILFLIMVFTTLSRSLIVINTFLFVFIIIKDMNWKRKVLILSTLSVLIFVYVPQTSVYKELSNITETQAERNQERDDVRVAGFKYYLNYNKDNYAQMLFGNGLYHPDSNYGKEISNIIYHFGMVPSDVGLVAFYFYFGLIGCMFFLIVFMKVIVASKNKETLFVSYYLTSAILGTIIGNQLFSAMIYISISLYLIYFQKTNKNVGQPS